VAQNYRKVNAGVVQLRGPRATEANLRSAITGRRLVHLACHGLTDLTHGNFFGALALTPGSATEPTNDGFLTLAELYELNLRGCELAILSACETNFGPQQKGEGTWALSRGFLVAGARRVTASNWLVDDEAAASLVSLFTEALAQRRQASQPPDHAGALLQAKRWLRQQEKWQSPYFWASLVLVGPD
jgi:CHAT domain-containing protein